MYALELSLATTIALLAVLISLVVRLRSVVNDNKRGIPSVVVGSVFVWGATAWQAIKNLAVYPDWFIDAAYPIIDILQVCVLLTGVVLLAVGLTAILRIQSERIDEVEVREQKLAILDNLQRDARQPYQFLELLNIAVKEIITNLPGCSGAIFLVNRSRRQFVLTASCALTRDETALLEYYPLERNVVSQAVDSGEPVVSGQFEFIDRDGKPKSSRFNSTLILPLASGMERLGGVIILSTKHKALGRNEIRYLAPVVEWLAEKIRTARLGRELTQAQKKVETVEERQSALITRVGAASKALSSSDPIESFCRSLAGFAGSRSVHLVGLVNGALQFHGGSEPIGDATESYRTALIDAVGRDRPLVVNQETEGDIPSLARSTLVYPLLNTQATNALLLIRESSPLKLGDDELREIDLFSELAVQALESAASRSLDVSRRRGFDRIVQLLQPRSPSAFEDDPGYFARHLAGVLPNGGAALTLIRRNGDTFEAADLSGSNASLPQNVRVQSEEGPIGNVIVSQKPILVSGRNRVEQALGSLSSQNSRALSGLFENSDPPEFVAVCPLVRLGETDGIALLFLDDITDSERGEWERLVTLATGLYSLRLTIDKLQSLRGMDDKAAFANERVGTILNTVNNHLSVVIGNAELAAADGSLDGKALNHVHGIIAEAQRAADYLESALGTQRAKPAAFRALISVNDLVHAAVDEVQISEGLYLVGGRTREIQLSLDHNSPKVPSSLDLKTLISEALNRFCAHAEDEDIVTVSTYRQGGDACIDISRHRRNFPAVERVAGFGEYIDPQRGLEIRPGDTFLSHIVNENVLYSYDRFSSTPSYISFRFPSTVDQFPGPQKEVQAKILAIDDQPVILELISAMCQTLGYEVKSASNGPEGIALAKRERFDLILTDLAMPDMSGLEVARMIRLIQPETPIILVTGWEVTVDRARLEKAGISDILYKPFRIEQLTNLVKSTAVSRNS